jgi:hypothetical protein
MKNIKNFKKFNEDLQSDDLNYTDDERILSDDNSDEEFSDEEFSDEEENIGNLSDEDEEDQHYVDGETEEDIEGFQGDTQYNHHIETYDDFANDETAEEEEEIDDFDEDPDEAVFPEPPGDEYEPKSELEYESRKWRMDERKNPDAAVRNRGDVVFPADSKKVKDDKDHFPINSISQARNALSRAGQYKEVPSWYSGSLTELKGKIKRDVKKKYPSIKVTE